eukprot:988144-Pelagomonas_calceolata.AAC.5
MSGWSSLHGAPPEYACMREQGMVCCRKVCCCPGTAYQYHSVSGRTGFTNFSASLVTLPPLVLTVLSTFPEGSTLCGTS